MNPPEDEQDPVLPIVLPRHLPEQAVVIVFVLDDVTAEVEDGKCEESGFDEVQDIHDATGSTIAVQKWMNGLELIVTDRHLDKRINTVSFVDVVFPIGHESAQYCFPLRGCIDDLPGVLVGKCGSRLIPNMHRFGFEDAADIHSAVGAKGFCLEGFESLSQGGSVAKCLFGVRIGMFLGVGILEKSVGCRDNVLNR